MRIAIPVQDGRLHEHFGGSRQFALVDVDVNSRTTLGSRMLAAPDHQPGLFPRWLSQHGVQTVIVEGIGRQALNHFSRWGITVRAGHAQAAVEDLVAAFLEGRLAQPPSGCNHLHHQHHGDHHHAPDEADPAHRDGNPTTGAPGPGATGIPGPSTHRDDHPRTA